MVALTVSEVKMDSLYIASPAENFEVVSGETIPINL